MSRPPDIDALSPIELKSLVFKLLEEQAEFRRTIGALRDEIARLKGGPGRPDIKANVKPSGMEKASQAEPSDPSGERQRRGGTRAKLTIDEERKLEADAPPGWRFKGYASFLVQDLMIRPFVTDFHRERWQTPDRKTVTAPLPPGVDGHFGPELRRFVLAHVARHAAFHHCPHNAFAKIAGKRHPRRPLRTATIFKQIKADLGIPHDSIRSETALERNSDQARSNSNVSI